MTQKIILVCDVCLNRNYKKNTSKENQRLSIKKFCPICNKHQIHKETR